MKRALEFLLKETQHRQFWLLGLVGFTIYLMMSLRTNLRDVIFQRAERATWHR
jgi:hypothetical protein